MRCVGIVLAAAACLLAVQATEPEAAEKPEFFYYNTATGESRWTDPNLVEQKDEKGNVYYYDPDNSTAVFWEHEKPEKFAWLASTVKEGEEHAGKTYYYNTVSEEVKWEVPDVLAWKKMSANRVFYYNQITGESVAERPAEMGFVDEKTGRTYWVDPVSGEATWESEHWWTEVLIEEGENAGMTYYVNEKSKESTFEKPKALGWVEWHEEL